MRKLITFILLLFALNSFSQNDLAKTAQQITEEGKALYRLELASWYGSDIFKENFQEFDRIGGYFSYLDSNTPKCLFYSKGEDPKVLGVVSFGDIQIIETASIDFKERDFKGHEKELYTIRTKALAEIQSDSLFKSYSNTNFNLIPIINNNEKKVYVLTGPQVEGVVLFGNDYLITFDKQNNVSGKRELHKNLIPINFDEKKEANLTFHSHSAETGDFITPTDICTLMLYAKFAGWKKHYAVAADYVSIWDCEKEELSIMTHDDFEKQGQNWIDTIDHK